MNTERLVAMVNDISAFFASTAVSDEAVASIASHLKRYWEPRMRKEIVAHLAQGGAGLSEAGRRAVQLLADSAVAAGRQGAGPSARAP
ncbi:MAG TPA: formate dehydrogenase subunit delta [Steroidobacteraceae bacterium]